jgi:hypothetical protein
MDTPGDPLTVSPLPGPGWMEVGDLPPSLTGPTAACQTRFFNWVSRLGAVVFGGVVGYLALQTIWTGGPAFLSGEWVGLFFAIAVPFGIADYFFTRWYFTRLLRATSLRGNVRLSVSEGELHLAPDGQPPYSVPLTQVWLSTTPVGEGWRRLTISQGSFGISYAVPEPIAARLTAEIARTPPPTP